MKRHGARLQSESALNTLSLETGLRPNSKDSKMQKAPLSDDDYQPSERIFSVLALEGSTCKDVLKKTRLSQRKAQKKAQLKVPEKTRQGRLHIGADSVSLCDVDKEKMASSILFDALGLDATILAKMPKRQAPLPAQQLQHQLVSMVAPKHPPVPKWVKHDEATLVGGADNDCSSSSTGAPSQDTSSEAE